MDTPEMQKEFQAWLTFQSSVSRPFRDLRWPHPRMKEPAEYYWWRVCASVLRRFDLFDNAGLVKDEERLFHERQFRELAEAESSARAAWIKRKKRLEMDMLCGRRKSLPWLV
jgi:hypothetical protein